MVRSTAKTDAQYQKEYDAQTLAEAEKIKADKTRFAGAKQAAKTLVTEQKKQTEALSKVAGANNKTSSTQKRKTPTQKRNTRRK